MTLEGKLEDFSVVVAVVQLQAATSSASRRCIQSFYFRLEEDSPRQNVDQRVRVTFCQMQSELCVLKTIPFSPNNPTPCSALLPQL